MVAKKGACRKRRWSKTGSLSLLSCQPALWARENSPDGTHNQCSIGRERATSRCEWDTFRHIAPWHIPIENNIKRISLHSTKAVSSRWCRRVGRLPRSACHALTWLVGRRSAAVPRAARLSVRVSCRSPNSTGPDTHNCCGHSREDVTRKMTPRTYFLLSFSVDYQLRILCVVYFCSLHVRSLVTCYISIDQPVLPWNFSCKPATAENKRRAISRTKAMRYALCWQSRRRIWKG